MAKEVKINLRLSMRVREALNDEAEVEDARIGTVTNRLLQEEIGRMMAVGADRCVMKDTKEYRALMPRLEGSYVLPTEPEINRYIATRLDDKNYPQVSLYFTKEQAEFMAGLVKKQRIRGTLYYNGSVKSYRYLIVGMLLKNPLFADFGLN